ncbi:MAG: hypothetical protein V7767_06570, partial [Leeuwenhoekiella sp.]
MIFRKFLFVILIIGVIIACTVDEEIIDLDDLRFQSFKIEKNDSTGLEISAQLNRSNIIDYQINDHGFVIFKNRQVVNILHKGELNSRNFNSEIKGGLKLGENYGIHPFVSSTNGYLSGDTLFFINKIKPNIIIKSLEPRSGFIGDTLILKGENFCYASAYSTNTLLLSDSEHTAIYESDTLIKYLVNPSIKSSILKPSILNCGLQKDVDGTFTINPPQFDSISKALVYVNDIFTIHGENLHPYISKVWIANIEARLEYSEDSKILLVNVPENLPVGKLDVKLQVLDKIIEKPGIYNSTTPQVLMTEPDPVGYLDTLNIRGQYLTQNGLFRNLELGNTPPTIISISDSLIKIKLDQLVYEDEPKLKIGTGVFNLEIPFNFLPPLIKSVDKEIYHLDDELTIYTDNFIFVESQFKIGNASAGSFTNFSFDSEEEKLTVSLDDYLSVTRNYSQYAFTENGTLDVKINHHYGSDNVALKIYPPEITNIQSEVYHSTTLSFEGKDLGYKETTQIYVDDEAIPVSGNSNYYSSNYKMYFPIPSQLKAGSHKLHVIRSGQKSNEVYFLLNDVIINNYFPKMGTRFDTYTITGANLELNTSYKIFANGYPCDILNSSFSEVSFKLPPDQSLAPEAVITLKYGEDLKYVGSIKV